MPVSPPQEELEHRLGNLSPVSPKPLHFPSPANIPILGKQMEPTFAETLPTSLAEPSAQILASDGNVDSQGFGNVVGEVTTPGVGHQSSASASADNQQNLNGSAQTNPMMNEESNNAADQPADASPHATIALGDHTNSLSGTVAQSKEEPQDAVDQETTTESQLPAEYLPTAQASSTNGPAISAMDFQSLLDDLAKPSVPVPNEETPFAQSTMHASSGPNNEAHTTSTNPHLPPRPPPQDRPSMHSNYTSNDDIRLFHPHNAAGSQPAQDSLPQIDTGTNVLPNPPMSQGFPATTSAQPSPIAQGFTPTRAQSHSTEDEDAAWTPELEKQFEQYLEQEKKHEQERNWQKFPPGSRLFVGNLPTEIVSKRNLYRILYRYGPIVQISIKKAYGFVQFLDAETCQRVLDAEQGAVLKGRKIHLEISHPQGVKEAQDGQRGGGGGRRRSRSPGHNRGSNSRNVDRYVTGSGRASSPRERDRDRHYRPGRSPSPRGNRGGKRNRSPDRYADRRRSPPGRYRSRSRSPQRRSIGGDDTGLPRRAPGQVPDVQILITDDLDGRFVSAVDGAFRSAYLSTHVLPLPPHVLGNIALLAKHYASERVSALVRLTHQNMSVNTISVLIFDYGGGVGNINFNQYDNLPPTTAAALVSGKKSAAAPGQYQAPPPMPNISPMANNNPGWPAPPMPVPSAQQGYHQPPPQQGYQSYPPPPNVPNALGNYGAPQGYSQPYPNQGPQRSPSTSGPPGPFNSRPPPLPFGAPPPPAHQQQFGGGGGPGYGGRGGPQGYQPPPHVHAPPPQSPQASKQQPDMAEIMAQLAKYNR